MNLLIFAFIFLNFGNFFSGGVSEKNPVPVAETVYGKVGGSLGKSINNQAYYAFEGIPYARPPIGKYRFKEAVPLKSWHATWQAKTIYKCMQYNQYANPGEEEIIGDEDCLYLNIYTPTLNKKANLNVIVYIHGGAFMFGFGGKQQPQIIMDEEIVYVNFNYRLGPLGFLSTEDSTITANNGIRDQILALKWIKENIQNFGGNHNSITISGMSAGASSVHLHYLTPKSKGLFNRGISQSGCALNPWVIMENALEKTKKLASILGCNSAKNSKEIIECMRNRPARQIVESVKHFQPWLYNPFSPFGVVVDSWASDPLLLDHPYNVLKNKQIFDAPWIISFTNSEGLYPAAHFYNDQHLQDVDSRWDEVIPFILHYNYTIENSLKDEVSQKIRNFYFKKEKVSKETFMNLVELIGDRLFLIDIEKAAKLHASASNSAVFVYHFAYRGAHSNSEFRTGTRKNFGASHADDTYYVFKTNMDVLSNENDRKVSKLLVKIFTTFAKYSQPEVTLKWPSLSKNIQDEFVYLKIDSPNELKLEKKVSIGNYDFWRSLPFKENENLLFIKDEL